MRGLLPAFVTAVVCSLSFGAAHSANEIVLDNVTGLAGGDTVQTNNPVRFEFRLTYTPGDGSAVTGFTNGFKVWTYANGVHTSSYSPITYDTFSIGWDTLFGPGFIFTPIGVDGNGEDTIGFARTTLFNPGILDGFDDTVWWVGTIPGTVGDTLCIDSSFYPPSGVWLWATNGPIGAIPPGWGGLYCFHVASCCIGIRGNIDGGPTEEMDVSDLMYLVNWGFIDGPPPPCFEEADLNADGKINIGDVTYIIDYLFRGGPPPADCP
jgi:hypothetical protein